MKKVLLALFILCIFLSPVNVFADQQDADKVEIENRYLVLEVPIYAECNYDVHTIIYGTTSFNGTIVSTSGRTVWYGTTLRYIYVYYDQYGNYYEPYFGGYTYVDNSGEIPGCPFR